MSMTFEKTLRAGVVTALSFLFSFCASSCVHDQIVPVPVWDQNFTTTVVAGGTTTVKCTTTSCLGSIDTTGGVTGPKYALIVTNGTDSAGNRLHTYLLKPIP
jgi:hypothetical protein